MRGLIKKALARLLCVLRRLLGPFIRKEVSVLVYHSISDSEEITAISPNTLEQHVRLLSCRGVRFVSLAEALSLAKDRDFSGRAVALTFDDGYADFELNALPILEKFQTPVTVFILGDRQRAQKRLGGAHELLSDMAVERLRSHPLVDIGFHGASHANMSILSEAELRQELHPPFPMRFFAYPGGAYSHSAAALAQEAGFEGAFAIKPGTIISSSHPYILPRNVILNTMRPWEVIMRTNRAMDWYRMITRAVR